MASDKPSISKIKFIGKIVFWQHCRDLFNKLKKILIAGMCYASLLLFFIPPTYAALPETGNVTITSPAGAVINSAAVGETVFIEAEYIDRDGRDDIRFVELLIRDTATRRVFRVLYKRGTNTLHTIIDKNTGRWTRVGYAPGSNRELGNSDALAVLLCSQTRLCPDPYDSNLLKVRWAVKFIPQSTGLKKIFIAATDKSLPPNNFSGMQEKGVFTITSYHQENTPPEIFSVTLESDTVYVGEAIPFIVNYRDNDGVDDITSVGLVIKDSDGRRIFRAVYWPRDNTLHIEEGEGENATLSAQGITPGSTGADGSHIIIGNNYVTLDCTDTEFKGGLGVLFGKWVITFSPASLGYKRIHLTIKDQLRHTFHYPQDYTIEVINAENLIPELGNINPSSGTFLNGSLVNFTATYSDADNRGDIRFAELHIKDSAGKTLAKFRYRPLTPKKEIHLLNDTGTDWGEGYESGSEQVLENSYVKLYCAQTREIEAGQNNTTLAMNWAIEFKSDFTGRAQLSLAAEDKAGHYVEGEVAATVNIVEVSPVVGLPQTVIGEISASYETDYYTFNANEGDNIYISCLATTGNVRPRVEIFKLQGSGRGEKIFSDIAIAVTKSATGFVSLPQTGRFLIVISDAQYSQTGRYILTLRNLTNPADIGTIAFGQTKQAEISTLTEIDLHSFTTERNDRLLITFAQTAGDLSGLHLSVLDSKGNSLISRPIPVGNNISVEFGLNGESQDNRYIIAVYYDGLCGRSRYNITLQRLNNPARANPVNFGETISDTISQPSAINTYFFTIQQDTHLFIPFATRENYLRPYVALYDKNGNKIVDASGVTGSISKTLISSQSDKYFLVIYDTSYSQTGSYAFSLQRLDSPQGAIELAVNEPQVASITNPAAINAFKLTVESPVFLSVEINRTTGLIQPYIEVYTPQLNLLDYRTIFSAGSSFSLVFPEAGTYYIYVRDDIYSRNGSYSIELKSDITSISFGTTATGRISAISNPADYYAFSAEEGDCIYITFGKTTGNLQPHVRLFDDRGGLIGSEYSNFIMGGGSYLFIELEKGGEFILSISDYNQAGSGDYAFTLQRLNNPGGAEILNFGQVTTARISTPTAINVYSFQAQEGDYILMPFAKVGIGDFCPYVAIYDEEGNKIREKSATSTASISHRFSRTGRYTIVIHDTGYTNTGSYSFTIQRLNNPGGAEELTVGEMENRISSHVQIHSFILTGQRDDEVSFEVARITGYRDFSPYLCIYDESGRKVADTNSSDSFIMQAERYFVYVYDDDFADTGTYRMSFIGPPPRISGVTINIEDGAKFYRGDMVEIIAQSSESDVEFQFIIDGEIMRDFESSGVFNWDTDNVDFGKHTVGLKVRNINGVSSTEFEIYILRIPIIPE